MECDERRWTDEGSTGAVALDLVLTLAPVDLKLQNLELKT